MSLPRWIISALASTFLAVVWGVSPSPPVPVAIPPQTPPPVPPVPPKGPPLGADGPALPFAIELGEPFTIPGVPGIQAFAYGSADVDGVKWLIVGGSTQGVHGFTADRKALGGNFPTSAGNRQFVVVDPVGKQAWTAPIDGLTAVDPAPLQAGGASYCQVGDTLYVVGGYGYSARAMTPGNMMTFPTLTAIDVPAAIRAVMAAKPLDAAIRQVQDPRLKVAGGGLAQLGGTFYLILGHSFDGMYAPVELTSNAPFQQSYIQRVVTFGVPTAATLQLASVKILDLSKPDPTLYRRRDFTIAPALFPGDVPSIAIYGGVFRPQGFAAYMNPIYITGTGATTPPIVPGLDTSFGQLLSQYGCPNLPLIDGATGDMHTVFFGGISAYSYDLSTKSLTKDKPIVVGGDAPIVRDGMPYIDTISSIRRTAAGASAGFVLPPVLPGLLGASAELLIDPTVPCSDNKVVRLDLLKGKTRVGHIFGGIRSSARYSNEAEKQPATTSSDLFIPVYVAPGPAPAVAMPAEPK